MAIRDTFNAIAGEYDRYRPQLIPCFYDFYGTILDVLPFDVQAEIRVLDLGCGTGLITQFLLERYPKASFVLLDLADEMLAVAAERFRGQAVELCLADYVAESFDGQFDLIVSGLSIHHLDGHDKARLFGKCHRHLKDGGLFINADQVCGGSAEIEALYRRDWLAKIRVSGLTEDQVDSALERTKEDRMSTLTDQLRWLKDAGFADVECWYKSFSFAVFGGMKKGG